MNKSDLQILGQEYLNEANILKHRAEFIRNKLRHSKCSMTREEQAANYKKLNMMYDMYLECKITGKSLINRNTLV